MFIVLASLEQSSTALETSEHERDIRGKWRLCKYGLCIFVYPMSSNWVKFTTQLPRVSLETCSRYSKIEP